MTNDTFKENKTSEEFTEGARQLAGCFIIVMFAKIVLGLKATYVFGQLVTNIQKMFIKTLAYISLLVFSILFFSAIFLAKYYGLWPWNAQFEDTAVYLFHAMLGNWNTTDFDVDLHDYDPMIVLYIFLLLSTIIMMNLFVAILTDIYGNLQTESTKIHREIMLVLGQHFSLDDKLASMNIVPPFNFILPLILPSYIFGLKKALTWELWVIRVCYSTFAIPLAAAVVTAINLLLLLPAFGYGILRFWQKKQWKKLGLWLLVGLPRLLWYCMKDIWYACKRVAMLPTHDMIHRTVLREDDKLPTELDIDDLENFNPDTNISTGPTPSLEDATQSIL